jgi:tetratricopeptide (TPR) repeat protein
MALARWLAAVLLLVLAVPASAQALPPKAQESYDLGFRLMLQGKVAQAIAKYEEALVVAPKSKVVLLEYVVALRKGSRFQQSAKAGWQLLEVDASNAAAWGNLGNTFLAAEEWEGAAFAFDRATTLDKDKAHAVQNLLNLGHAQCDAGDPAGALKVFAKAAKVDPKNALTLIDTAIAHSRLGNKQAAMDSMKAAFALLAKQNDARAEATKRYAEVVQKRVEAEEPIRSTRPAYRQALPKSLAKQPAKGKAAALPIETQSVHTVDVGEGRLASLTAPENWTLQVELPPDGTAGTERGTLVFTAPPGARFQMLISLLGADKTLEQIKEQVEVAWMLLQFNSKEKQTKPELRELTSETLQGYYFSEQDKKLIGKEPAEGDYPFCTQGVARVGGISCTFTLLTFDLEDATLTPLFATLKGLAVKAETK